MTQHPSLHSYKADHVAEELALMDGGTLRRITPSEIQGGAWMDKRRKDEVAPNVMAMVKSFNQLALLVPTEILEETTPQGRAKVISKYIKIAVQCYKLKNYNSLKAILAGLHCSPVYRLDKTWKHVSNNRTRTLDQLTQLMSEEDNSALYREDLELQWSTRTPCIPFLGHFLTQVVFVDSFRELRSKRGPLVAQPSTTVYTELSAVTVSTAAAPSPNPALASHHVPNGGPVGAEGAGPTPPPTPIARADSGSWEQYVRHQGGHPRGETLAPHPAVLKQHHRTMSDSVGGRGGTAEGAGGRRGEGCVAGTPDAPPRDYSSRESSPDPEEAIVMRVLRRKRQTAPLLQLQGEVVNGLGTPLAYLHKMQLYSLGCCAGVESRACVRELIGTAKRNTEAHNYKLSCDREPA